MGVEHVDLVAVINSQDWYAVFVPIDDFWQSLCFSAVMDEEARTGVGAVQVKNCRVYNPAGVIESHRFRAAFDSWIVVF
ncbi:hypothetical protein GCM10007924_20460 [Sneathiella chinensis]|uniref:Uncharacterized protein n=1 Tax=Sneathiella chinensis TaxID=349750 RepID=A0ABQ5U3U4_9PROT|nr:hypothetical protein GCM10007924_20460 [Sneathiella chinensis]